MSPATVPTLPRWLHPANRLVRTLQRLGLPLGTIRVLTVAGRSSGQPRSTPVSPVRVAGRDYVIAALPQADWARNVRAAGEGDLRHRRTVRRVHLQEVTDRQLRRQVVRAFPTEVPHGVPFFVRLGMVTGPDPDQFAEISDHVAVFELTDAPTG